MDVLTAIQTRSSAIRLAAPGPSDEHLQLILEAGAHAPDHGRLTPWRFVVLAGQAREVLAGALVAARRRRQPDAPAENLASERGKALRAPTIVAVCAQLKDMGDKVPAIEQIVAVGAAVQNMWLAAHALGYGAMWKTGPAAYDPDIKAALGIPAEQQVVAYLYLGTMEQAGTPRPAELGDRVRRL